MKQFDNSEVNFLLSIVKSTLLADPLYSSITSDEEKYNAVKKIENKLEFLADNLKHPKIMGL